MIRKHAFAVGCYPYGFVPVFKKKAVSPVFKTGRMKMIEFAPLGIIHRHAAFKTSEP
jgi:hypothetical protein